MVVAILFLLGQVQLCPIYLFLKGEGGAAGGNKKSDYLLLLLLLLSGKCSTMWVPRFFSGRIRKMMVILYT